MKAVSTILLLLLSNTFMTLAWYGHGSVGKAGEEKIKIFSLNYSGKITTFRFLFTAS